MSFGFSLVALSDSNILLGWEMAKMISKLNIFAKNVFWPLVKIKPWLKEVSMRFDEKYEKLVRAQYGKLELYNLGLFHPCAIRENLFKSC